MSHEFHDYLKSCGIVPQLTPPGTPQRNGVSERRNRTFLDMVRSMVSQTDLPLSFWGYCLETTAFTVNRVPSKSVEKTLHEMWTGRKPSLSFLKIWGCEAFFKRLQSDKLTAKLDKCIFWGIRGKPWVTTSTTEKRAKCLSLGTVSSLRKSFSVGE